MNKKVIFRLRYFLLGVLLGLGVLLPGCTRDAGTVNSVMDKTISALYASKTEQELASLTSEKVMALFSDKDIGILSSGHWMFDVNVPVTISVMRDSRQKTIPFWLNDGFRKTNLTMKNEQTVYEVWQKPFRKGKVGLGVNGFDNDGLHYFVSVAPQQKGDSLIMSNFYPVNQFVGILDNGAFTYHDWDELVLSEVPEEMKGQKLL